MDALRRGAGARHEVEPHGRSSGGLTWRMITASVVLAVLVSGAFALLLVAIDDLRDAERRTEHAQDVLVAANRLERLLLDLETGQRGFILTNKERFLDPWDSARRAFPRQAADLRALVSAEPAVESEAQQIAERGRAYIGDYSEPLVAAARRGDSWVAGEAATEEGRVRVDAIRRDFDRLIDTERRTDADAKASADTATRRATVAATVGIAGSLVLVALFTGYLARVMLWPVRRAAGMANRFAGGELSARMPETGPGEIGALARAFNVMGGSLRRRTAEQDVLRRVATLVAENAQPDTIFHTVIREVAELCDADMARIERYEPDGTVRGVAAWSRDGEDKLAVGTRFPVHGMSIAALVKQKRAPARVESFGGAAGEIAAEARALGLRSSIGAPIVVAGRLWGVIAASSRREEAFPPRTEAQIGEFTELVATAIANAEATAELAASRARIVAAGDETRRRIERDLHDGAQQRLVSLALQLRAAQATVPADFADLQAELDRVATGLGNAMDELREYARGIHPAILAEGGLDAALRTLARRSAVPVVLQIRMDARLPERIEVAAYYIVSEALANAAKHAHATAVTVDVAVDDAVLQLLVRDDGVGGARFADGSGLVGLKDRVDALGGQIAVESPVGEGTSISVRLPIAGG